MNILSSLLKDFDITAMLPAMDTFLGRMQFICGLCVVVCPLLLLIFGLLFFFKPAKTPKGFGFRSYFVTGSAESWQFAQRLAGMCFMILGGATFVAALIFSLFLRAMDGLQMTTASLVWVIAELVLVVGIHIFINLRVLKFFDKDGHRK